MERRSFIKTTVVTAAALAAQGYLPLLAAERRRGKAKKSQASTNTFVEPSAIEPITGYLPSFSPTGGAAMVEAFKARYSLVTCTGSGAKSRNRVSGTMDVSLKNASCSTVETRSGKPRANVVKTSLQLSGESNTVSKWTLASTVEGRKDLGFTEAGRWDGKTMTVKAKSWTQERVTTHRLIGRWALLPLLASGKLKKKPLVFDMLDDSTLRPNQTLRYEGETEIPVKGGTATVDSYVQTGQGIVPTHYLVDKQGRVQLITMSTVNWALAGRG
jgi:hypothetical protein